MDQSGAKSFSFLALCKDRNTKNAAAKFHCLLVLKKQLAVEVSQTAPYADIVVTMGPEFYTIWPVSLWNSILEQFYKVPLHPLGASLLNLRSKANKQTKNSRGRLTRDRIYCEKEMSWHCSLVWIASEEKDCFKKALNLTTFTLVVFIVCASRH